MGSLVRKRVLLELKVLAMLVWLVSFRLAVAAKIMITSAKPKIGAYHFTTRCS